MYSDNGNHGPSLLMMNCGHGLTGRPSMGSWITYGLGTENQNLPGFVVLCPGYPVLGAQLWSSTFLPSVYQGTYIPSGEREPDKLLANIRNKTYSTAEQQRAVVASRQAGSFLSGASGTPAGAGSGDSDDGGCLPDADGSAGRVRYLEGDAGNARPVWGRRFRARMPDGVAPCGTRDADGAGLFRKFSALG